METQNQIKRKLNCPEAIEYIQNLLDMKDNTLSRTKIADQICEHYQFFDGRGHFQRSSCLKTLRELQQQGCFVLPPPRIGVGRTRSPRRLTAPVELPRNVPAEAGNVGELQLVLVQNQEQMRIWNEMMLCEHPQGAGPLVGHQLYYLIDSEHGWLGGLGFGASALALRDRDRWIGWDAETRRAHLHRVIGLSRFLIRSDVRCRNLASRVLGMVMRQMPGDFEKRFGFSPWLVESFVDTSCFSGTCYRAANWVHAGRTQGRGRQDRYSRKAKTVKDIYLYLLKENFRDQMKPQASANSLPALKMTDGLEGDNWTKNEFAGAPLGDKRLSSRLSDSAALKAKEPGRAFSGVAEGDWAAVKGYYRLIDHADESAVTMDNILLPHRGRTIQRMKAQNTVLCIQDGTDLDYSGLNQCEGLDVIGTNQTGGKSKGLHLHCTIAVTTDGLPLGVLRAQHVVPRIQSGTDNRSRSAIPIQEKGSYCWIEGARDCMKIAQEMPDTRLVSVMDREADIFELFDEHRQNPCIDLLVRAQHNRCTMEDRKLFDAVRDMPVAEKFHIHVQRQSARPKKKKQKIRAKRSGRTAEVSLRYKLIEVRPSAYLKHKAPIALWAIHVVEDNPPAQVEGIEWFLLTTIEMHSVCDVLNCIHWYCLRWRIEDWHRVLKSGCRVEEAAHKTSLRLKRAIAINLVIAWRIMLMTLLGRETPELPAEVLFSDLEIEVLNAYAKKKTKTGDPTMRSSASGCSTRRLSLP
ncbi:MAG: IS4 family transposase [Desulfosalsimonadaceae bacterium]|nr:IS4 family transposase [Desulfosalsimonadaceae bacterium]